MTLLIRLVAASLALLAGLVYAFTVAGLPVALRQEAVGEGWTAHVLVALKVVFAAGLPPVVVAQALLWRVRSGAGLFVSLLVLSGLVVLHTTVLVFWAHAPGVVSTLLFALECGSAVWAIQRRAALA